jgi:hypothetical protein
MSKDDLQKKRKALTKDALLALLAEKDDAEALFVQERMNDAKELATGDDFVALVKDLVALSDNCVAGDLKQLCQVVINSLTTFSAYATQPTPEEIMASMPQPNAPSIGRDPIPSA